MDMTVKTWSHRYITTNGIRMHYVTQGNGPLIILLHGFPEFWYSWRYQIPFLAEHGYTVVAPDLRGYNETDKPLEGYDVFTLTQDIAGLINGLGQKKAIIVGHDWGGGLAWIFASRYPEMTKRLIIMNAPHPLAFRRELLTFQQLRKSWYIIFFQIPWLPEYLLLRNNAKIIGDILQKTALQKSCFSHEDIAKFQAAMRKPGTMTAALNYYRQAVRHAITIWINNDFHVKTQTLLIWGEKDSALSNKLTIGLEHWVDNISIQRIPDSGHWVQQEKPNEVNQLIINFLNLNSLN
jgi:pimeloyl-ACP methyl ester carboxylesterase